MYHSLYGPQFACFAASSADSPSLWRRLTSAITARSAFWYSTSSSRDVFGSSMKPWPGTKRSTSSFSALSITDTHSVG
jgi:hypothetical protein